MTCKYCPRKLRSDNKSGVCYKCYGASSEYRQQRKDREAEPVYRQHYRAYMNAHQARYTEEHPERSILTKLRFKGRKIGIPCDLMPEDVVTPLKCPVFGVPLEFRRGKGQGGGRWSPSVDRIDPEKGYVRGNIQILSELANRMKTDATPDELRTFARWIREVYGE